MVSKIFLKILTNQIDEHMQDSNHWSKHQNDFKKNMRTEDNFFILKTIIHNTHTVNNKPLHTYCANFGNCFETIN